MAQVTIASGFDVNYYLDQVGADYYLSAAGEPPGIWAGTAAARLGLSGAVDPKVMRGLYHHDVAPDGTVLGTRQKKPEYAARAVYAKIQERIDRRIADLGGLATPEQVRTIRLEERAKGRTSTPYYDMTFSAEKSVSLAPVGFMAAARRARQEGREQDAERLEARARSVEAAVMAGADAMLGHVERRGAIVRTGHHSATSGEYRDAGGFVAAKFLQHTSRSGDPQLHVQIPILNRAQRADEADEKWRALDGRPLWAERLGAAAYAGLAEAQALARLGLPLVKRADGNGFEIGGVDQATMDAFSARTADISAKLAERIAEYEAMFGHPPNRQALFLLRKRVTVETRAAKQKPAPAKPGSTAAQAQQAEDELTAWARRAVDEQVQALDALPEAIEAYAAEHPGARPSELPSQAERAEIIRAAVAEVQRQNASWTRAKLEWELYRQLPVLPAAADWGEYLSSMADDVMTGRAEGVNVLQIAPAPDVVDVSRLGFRKDGTSIYRKPGEARYVTQEHLDLEEWILSRAKAPVRQAMTKEAAAAAIAGSALDFDQRSAARGLLTSRQAVTCLVAPAGTGKTFVMAQFSRAWMAETGCRVIGLTLAENAARVMAGEGMTEAWNIAKFFAHHVPVYRDDVLVIDEASQVSTADLARIMNLAQQAGARVILTGDTEQLGPVEAGGMFRLIASDYGHWKLAEVRRFQEAWEREASLQLRAGDLMAWREYGSRGRVWDGPQDRVYDEAVDMWLTDVAQGKTSLLLAGSNEDAAKLSAMVRARRIERGLISGEREITLADGNPAGTGDLVRARLNSKIDADGQPLTNRDTLRIEGWTGTGTSREAIVVRQTGGPDEWSAQFTVPASYLADHAELAYAGNVYVAQGRTVDVGRLVVTEHMSRDMLYVGMTRGRERNVAHVVTGPADPADLSRQQRDAYTEAGVLKAGKLIEQGEKEAALAVPLVPPEPEGMRARAPWESVVAAAMQREEPLRTAIENMREAQAYPSSFRHLYDLKQAFWWKDVVPKIDEMVRQRIPEREYERYLKDPERPAFLQELRAHELGGRRIADVLDSITARSLDGARSIAAVLHGRAGKEPAPVRGETRTWTDRTPETAPAEIREVDEDAARHQAELGEQLAARPPEWALAHWGVPPKEQGALRDDWMNRAAIVESYRQLAGITDPRQAIGPAPAGQAELREGFAASVRALELADEAAMYKAMGRGDLEATVRQYERAAAVAPPEVRPQLDSADRQHDYAKKQAERARQAGNEDLGVSADHLANMTGAERERLRVADAARREWDEATAAQANAAQQAREELHRRGPERPDPEQAGPVQDTRGAAPEPQAGAERAPEGVAEAEQTGSAEIREVIDAARERYIAGPQPESQASVPLVPAAAWEEYERRTAERDAKAAPDAEADTPEVAAPPVTGTAATRGATEFAAEAETTAEPMAPEAATTVDPVTPEAIAALDAIQTSIDAAAEGVASLAEADAARAAEVDEAGINEPVTLQAQAEAQAEASWEPGTTPDSHVETEADTELEI